MKVFNGFAGSDILRQILQELSIKVSVYNSSEIDKNAIQVSKRNFNDINYLGDITKIDPGILKNTNLFAGGSPCQGFSRNGKGLNFEDARSGLFFEWNKLREKISPEYFFLENVNMKREWQDIITDTLGVEPIKTCGGDYSAQKRPRTFWTNIPLKMQGKTKEITINDILEDDAVPIGEITQDEKDLYLMLHNGKVLVRNATKDGFLTAMNGDSINLSFPNSTTRRGKVGVQKANTLDVQCNQAVYIHNELKNEVRKFSIVELERLQGYDDNFTFGISLNERKKIIGNGWNKEQVKDLLRGL